MEYDSTEPDACSSQTNLKKVLFNDDIEIIGISDPHIDRENEMKILDHLDQMNPYEVQPKKLFSEESTSETVPPKSFLHDLNHLMSKKLEMTLKVSEGDSQSLHQALGLENSESEKELFGQEGSYSKDEDGNWAEEMKMEIYKSEIGRRIAKANKEWEIS